MTRSVLTESSAARKAVRMSASGGEVSIYLKETADARPIAHPGPPCVGYRTDNSEAAHLRWSHRGGRAGTGQCPPSVHFSKAQISIQSMSEPWAMPSMRQSTSVTHTRFASSCSGCFAVSNRHSLRVTAAQAQESPTAAGATAGQNNGDETEPRSMPVSPQRRRGRQHWLAIEISPRRLAS